MDFAEVRRRAIARYETPPALAEFLAEQVHGRLAGTGTRFVLDPTCGSGGLLAPFKGEDLVCYGVDIDAEVAAKAARACQTPLGGRVKVGNALLDPIGPWRWAEFLAEERALLRRLADLRSAGDFATAECLSVPLRRRLATLLPPVLADAQPFCWPLEFPEVFLAPDPGFGAIVTNPPWDKFKLHSREFFDPALRRLHQSDQRRIRARRLAAMPFQEALIRERRRNAAFQTYTKVWSTRESREARSRGDANAYLAVLDLAHQLLGPTGVLGAIVPGGFWADYSALGWRNRLFEDHDRLATWSFAPRTDAFPDIDQRAAVLVARRQAGRSPAIRISVASGLTTLAELQSRPTFDVPVAVIRRSAPETAAVPPLETPLDLAIVEKLYATGPPFANGKWQPIFGRELDMTADADAFDGVWKGAPLWEGKRIGPFELCPVDAKVSGALPACKASCTRAASCPYERRNGHQLWVDEARLGKRDHGHAAHTRVAWRSVARTDRARRLEA
ncbi:MAG: hypothetical protein FJZ00_07210, partial [Candidatus Sericytochromatia bacterium]|nr:hypothetical protein [Candidatus Tanganyikabacteria bacterium]